MKFSFVNPTPYEEIFETDYDMAKWPPLGILYMATILKERGVEVSVLDQPARGYSIEETLNWIQKEDPDILGFSTFSTTSRTASLLSNEVKTKNPDITIVYGGYFATFNADRVLRGYPNIDIVVRGEGENTVVELVDCLKEGKELKDVTGLTFREGDSIVTTPERPLIKDLDSLPFPDRSLLEVEYHSIVAGLNITVKKFTSIISSRGCVHRCRFCSCPKIARNVWRQRSVENTLKELHGLTAEGYEQFLFIDDSFTLNQKRVIKLCKRIREEKIGIDWACEGRVDCCSFEMLREMARAGCKVIFLGIESANQRILDYYNKKITPQQSRSAVEKARKAGVDLIVGSFILGAPDETKKEIRNTLDFAESLPIDFPQFNVLWVHPGMDIWNELKTKGLLQEDEHWETGVKVAEICPSAVPLKQIDQMIRDAVDDFIGRPGFILRQLGRTLKSPYRLGIVKKNLSRIRLVHPRELLHKYYRHGN